MLAFLCCGHTRTLQTVSILRCLSMHGKNNAKESFKITVSLTIAVMSLMKIAVTNQLKRSAHNPKEDVGKQITALTINWVPMSKF